MLLARGMLRRDVELGEIVVVAFDVRALGDGKAHVAEDLDHLVEHLTDGMDAPVLQGADADGQRHVGLLAGEPGRERAALQHRLAALQRLADARLEPVDRLPEGLALLRRQRAQRRHQLGHAPLPAERGDAHALDGGEIGSRTDLGDASAPSMAEMSVVSCHQRFASFPRRRGIHAVPVTTPVSRVEARRCEPRQIRHAHDQLSGVDPAIAGLTRGMTSTPPS